MMNSVFPGLTQATWPVKVDLGLELQSQTKKPDFVIFPNPAHSQIEVSAGNTIKEHTISLFEIDGHIVRHAIMAGNKLVIDITDLPTGTYLLLIQSDETIYTEHIVKE